MAMKAFVGMAPATNHLATAQEVRQRINNVGGKPADTAQDVIDIADLIFREAGGNNLVAESNWFKTPAAKYITNGTYIVVCAMGLVLTFDPGFIPNGVAGAFAVVVPAVLKRIEVLRTQVGEDDAEFERTKETIMKLANFCELISALKEEENRTSEHLHSVIVAFKKLPQSERDAFLKKADLDEDEFVCALLGCLREGTPTFNLLAAAQQGLRGDTPPVLEPEEAEDDDEPTQQQIAPHQTYPPSPPYTQVIIQPQPHPTAIFVGGPGTTAEYPQPQPPRPKKKAVAPLPAPTPTPQPVAGKTNEVKKLEKLLGFEFGKLRISDSEEADFSQGGMVKKPRRRVKRD